MFLTEHINCKKKIKEDLGEKFITQVNESAIFYLTVVDDNTLIINTAPSYRKMYYGSKTISYSLDDHKKRVLIKDMNTISHNFTLIKNHESKEIWGVGGCGKRNKKDFTDGIYLLYSKNNMKSWKMHNNIIVAKDTKGWNPNGDSTFDSNITCFYSTILKKYLLFTRYNIGGGSRGIQLFTTSHYKRGWDKGKLCHIDTYKIRENYYMNKIIEVPEHKVFIMVAPFSDLKKRSDSGLKVMVSKNAVEWYDCGLVKKARVVDKHTSTPNIQPVDLILKGDILSIWYHDHYFSNEKSNIYKINVNIQNFIGCIFDKKQLTTETLIKTSKIKVICEMKPTSSVKIIINKKDYSMDKNGIIELNDSNTLNETCKILWNFNDVIVYGFTFV